MEDHAARIRTTNSTSIERHAHLSSATLKEYPSTRSQAVVIFAANTLDDQHDPAWRPGRPRQQEAARKLTTTTG